MDRRSGMARLRTAWQAAADRHPRVAGLLQTLAVAGQLALVIVLIREFEIETEGFLRLAILTWAGFLVHAQLPRAWRLPFFCGLSLLGIVLVLGPVHALWLVATGGFLIGLCHLPIRFGARVAALAAAGACLAAMRGAWLPGPIPDAIWPILGSIFMFRLVHYLYDLRHRKEAPSAAWALAYFFMLPNVCFPLFPVVDYARFRTTHYSEDAHRIYQRGVGWMFRGILHLLAYRFVYQEITLDPSEVTTTVQLVQYAIGSFLLYLRVSGHFHLIVGMLLLFGFNLPETHHLYFFASSFSDFWRRINIYWKDFMMKLFYYPAYFRLRSLGPTTALVLSTGLVFAATWALHAYQWFWLRGSLLLEANDALFWLLLGVAMIANSLYELRHGRRRSLPGQKPGALALCALALRTVATFVLLCTLWSMWSSDDLAQWLGLWRTTRSGWLAALLALAVPALVAASFALDRQADRRPARRRAAVARPAPFFWADVARVGLPLLVVAALSRPEVSSRLGVRVAGVVESIQVSRLNTRDAALLERGYYEHLIAVNRENAELWQLYSGKPRDWVPIVETEAWRPKADMQLGELVPDTDITWLGRPLHINRWGFRDRDYEPAKTPGNVRIALLGSSHVFGFGVGDEDVFENVLEQRLNAEAPAPGAFEVLNFAVPNQNVVMNLELLQRKVVGFDPDVIIHFAHEGDAQRIRRYVPQLVQAVDVDEIPYPFLRDLLRGLDIDRSTPESIIERRIGPQVEEILDWGYRELAALCRRHGAVPVFILIPLPAQRSGGGASGDETPREWLRRAQAAGFETFAVLDAYDGHALDELKVAPWDNHPNALGHRLLAERIHRELHARPDLLRARSPDADGQAARRAPPGGMRPPASAAATTSFD